MRRPYHVVDRLNLLMPSASAIKLLSNPRILINALACGSGINRNSRVANQLNNLTSGINYYLVHEQIIQHLNISFSSTIAYSSKAITKYYYQHRYVIYITHIHVHVNDNCMQSHCMCIWYKLRELVQLCRDSYRILAQANFLSKTKEDLRSHYDMNTGLCVQCVYSVCVMCVCIVYSVFVQKQ